MVMIPSSQKNRNQIARFATIFGTSSIAIKAIRKQFEYWRLLHIICGRTKIILIAKVMAAHELTLFVMLTITSAKRVKRISAL